MKRNAELAEVQRLENAEKRRHEEKERRIAEQEKFFHEKKAAAEKIAAQSYAQILLRDIMPNVFTALTTNGFFYDAIEREVEQQFMPLISNEIDGYMDREIVAYNIVDGKPFFFFFSFLLFRTYPRSYSSLQRSQTHPCLITIQTTKVNQNSV